MQDEQHSPPDRLRCGSGWVKPNKPAMVDRPYPACSRLWRDIDEAVSKLTPDQFRSHDVHGLAAWIPLALPGCRIVVAFVTYDQEWREPFAHAFCEIHGA